MVSAIIASAWVGSGSAIAALSTPRGASRAAWITLGAVLGPLWAPVALEKLSTDDK